MKKIIIALNFIFVFLLISCGPKEPLNTIEIVVDGGGANISFNSTLSMTYDKYANPYPYNTLEVLANEWNANHQGYKITIASSSINNDRETMVPALNQGTAPDIIFYLGTTITEDMSKGWFVDIKEYLEQPNKYSLPGELGSVRWRDIYGDEYETSFAPNGEKYTVELELNPIGICYNKTLFNQLQIEEPVTFYDFMVAQDTIYNYAVEQNRADKTLGDYLCPYMPYYPWYGSILETQLYSEYIDAYDVIVPNGLINGEEFARAFMKKDSAGTRLYSPDDARSIEKARLNKVLAKYYPTNFESYYAEQQFAAGNLVMMEAQGGTVKKLIDAIDGAFEVGFFSFPYLTTRPENVEACDYMDFDSEGAYYTSYNVDKRVRRGLSGYTSGWAVTNSASKKGQGTVDACVDFLQYVTCFTNNDRLINDRGFSIPLSGRTSIELFSSLANDYLEDVNSEEALPWGACCASAVLNKSYYDADYLSRIAIIKANSEEDVLTILASLKTSYSTAINNLYKQNKWDTSKWLDYSGDLIK